MTPEGEGQLPPFSGVNKGGDPYRADRWKIAVGGQGAGCLGSVELWLRLLATEGWAEEAAILVAGPTWTELESAVPRSRHSRTFLGQGELPGAFAWVAGHFALGAPTEDAWERFVKAAQRP